MRPMKPSGIEWIGEIPEGWEVRRFKTLLSSNKNSIRVGPFGSQIKGNDFIDSGFKVYNQRTVLDANFYNGDAFINEDKFLELVAFKVNPFDILITSRGSIGKIAIAPNDVEDGIIHPCVIKATMDLNNVLLNYLKYIFNETDISVQQLILNSNSTTIEVVYSGQLKNIYLPYTPLPKQQAISDYLDRKCNLIDSTIEKQKTVIEKLHSYKQSLITESVTKGLNPNVKMKPSGIEWIGDIPKHWILSKLKFQIEGIKDGTHGTYERIDKGFPLLSSKNVHNNGIKIDENESQISYKDHLGIIGNGFPKKGDLLVTIVGTIGRCCVYELNESLSFQRSVCFLRPNSNLDIYFLYYCSISKMFSIQLENLTNKSAQGGVYMGSLKEIIIPFMEKEEQKQIVGYLNAKCSEIDNAINGKQNLIEKLADYKKSLIYECVTGKKEVTVNA